MPELPEVETVARGLQKEIAGRQILSVVLGKTDFIDNPVEVERELPGRKIRVVERFGKFLLLRLTPAEISGKKSEKKEDGDAALLVHLGMTGSLMPRATNVEQAKHTHVVMLMDDGRELRYVDPRRFGRIAFLSGKKLQEELGRFGLDPLAAKSEEFVEKIRGKKARIKAQLLDQGVLRGVGNIYADESLWKAKIHPAQLAAKLTKEKGKELYTALQEILQKAIMMRGSSISDFLGSDGLPGEYQGQHRVYGREGEKCFRCRTVIQRTMVAGRSSFFCPKCQMAPRGWKDPMVKRKKERAKKRISKRAGGKNRR
jgi:formamidopyrimidine-DNA glycosylase